MPLLAGAAALLPFLPALDAGFLNWDDAGMLVGETGWRGVGTPELRWMLGATVMATGARSRLRCRPAPPGGGGGRAPARHGRPAQGEGAPKGGAR